LIPRLFLTLIPRLFLTLIPWLFQSWLFQSWLFQSWLLPEPGVRAGVFFYFSTIDPGSVRAAVFFISPRLIQAASALPFLGDRVSQE
jgi:hypothetical protein